MPPRHLERDDVFKVYALSRASSAGSKSKDRHIQTFEKEHGAANLLSESSKVEFYDGDPALDFFGLSEEVFAQVISFLTLCFTLSLSASINNL